MTAAGQHVAIEPDRPWLSAEFEKRFILDFIAFGRTIVPRQARRLVADYASAEHEAERDGILICIHTLLVQQYEHVAAWIRAFQRKADSGVPVLESLLTYRPGEADLTAVLAGIDSGDTLAVRCGLSKDALASRMGAGPVDTRLADMWEGLVHSAPEQLSRKPLYNKAKHGMVFVSGLQIIRADWPADTGPAAIFSLPGRTFSVSVSGLPRAADQARQTRNVIGKLADVLGDLLTLYLMSHHVGAFEDILHLFRTKNIDVFVSINDDGHADKNA
jgi:hypothetical protein